MELISLKELCQRVGVTRRSIQCYESEGLMGPNERNKYGHLLYDVQMIERARFIRFLQEAGFKLKDISKLINADPNVVISELESRLPELEKKELRLNKLIDEVREYIEQLKNIENKEGE